MFVRTAGDKNFVFFRDREGLNLLVVSAESFVTQTTRIDSEIVVSIVDAAVSMVV